MYSPSCWRITTTPRRLQDGTRQGWRPSTRSPPTITACHTQAFRTTWPSPPAAPGALPTTATTGCRREVSAAGIQWRAYMEGMTGGCLNSPYPYALKHNPFAYYGNGCPQQVVPFTQFAAAMKGNVPRLVWITPDMCHDGHDCSMAVTDNWLSP